MNLSSSVSATPKKGVSTLSSGNSDLDAKVRADSHSFPSRRMGIDTIFAFRCKSSRFSRHHRFEDLGKFASFVFVSWTHAARSSFRTFAHFLYSSSKRSVPSAAFFCRIAALLRSFSHGWVLFLFFRP